MNADQAFSAYEEIREALPPTRGRGNAVTVSNLDAIADRFDVFLLDAFGVLNIGEQAIPGVADRIDNLRARNKRVMIVTNAAGYPHSMLMDRYHRLGYTFDPKDVVSSRAALLSALSVEPQLHWGLMATKGFGTEGLDNVNVTFLDEDPIDYEKVEGFLLLGSSEWTETRQLLLESTLRITPRPVWVGNPDIVAPRETGHSIEPGFFAHRLARETGVVPRFFGKPFANIFRLVFSRVGPVPKDRIVMVGDSLHTDILGAQTVGIASALVTDYGFFAQSEASSAIQTSGLYPDYLMPRP